MVDTQSGTQSRTARWGWRILLVVSALFGLNGVAWFFFGPGDSVSEMAENMGLSAADLEATYPMAADAIVQQARRVAVYLAAIGTMGFVAASAGQRTGAKWGRNVTWILICTMLALFLVGLAGGLGAFEVTLLFLAVIALTGHLLARRTHT